jgi:hypothetical protein
VGVADPASRSARFRHFYSDDSPVIKLAGAAARRWPWLDDDDPPSGPGPHEGEESIEIGRRHYYGGGSRGWIDWGEQGSDRLTWTLWPLEALLGTVNASEDQETQVRGENSTRYLAKVLPGDAARAGGVVLVDPPKSDDSWRELDAEVCIDSSGLIRRIAWSPAFSKRFKPGLLPRIATSFANEPPTTYDDAESRIWYLIEFWDYGCEVDIGTPTRLIDTSDTSLRTIVRDLWRMKRDYEKRHGG